MSENGWWKGGWSCIANLQKHRKQNWRGFPTHQIVSWLDLYCCSTQFHSKWLMRFDFDGAVLNYSCWVFFQKNRELREKVMARSMCIPWLFWQGSPLRFHTWWGHEKHVFLSNHTMYLFCVITTHLCAVFRYTHEAECEQRITRSDQVTVLIEVMAYCRWKLGIQL